MYAPQAPTGVFGRPRLAERYDIEQIGRVFDLGGLRVSQVEVASHGLRETIDVAPFPDGVYSLAGRTFSVEKGDLGRQLLPESLIASVHVPKAAGTSVRSALERAFGPRLVLDYGDFPLSSDFEARARTAYAHPSVFVPRSAAAVHGHFLASKYRAASPRLAIWFRDPVQRAASHYQFWRDNAGDDDPNHTKRRFLESGHDLAGFAEMPEMRDVYARFLDGVPLRAFAFVGIVEQFARGLRLFARVFGLPAVPEPVALNVRRTGAPDRGHDVPEDVARRIAGLNRVDLELHAEATRRFEALCREHGVE